MPSKNAATKKKKKTGSKTAEKAAPKASSNRSATPSGKEASKQSKSTGRTPSTSTKKGTSKKTSSKKKAGSSTKKTTVQKSGSKKTRSISTKKVVAKPASSKKKVSSKSAPSTASAASKGSKAQPAAPKAATSQRKTSASALFGPIHSFQPYQPKRGEPYMSDEQLEHFRTILLAWKRELMEEVDRTVLHMQGDAANFPDPNDRATQESEFGLELRTRDRERKLLKKIDSALRRIDDGSYGYCEETGDEIGLRRLEARPVATLCVEAQERRELAERQFRDREDYYR